MSNVSARSLLGGAALALVLLTLAPAVIGMVQLDAALAHYDHVSRTRTRARLALRELSSVTFDLETGLRGALLTGDDAFLAPYHDAERRMPRVLRELVAASPDPAWQGPARRIAADLPEWQAQVALPALAHPAHDDVSLALQRDGKRRIDAVRVGLGELDDVLASIRHRERASLHAVRNQQRWLTGIVLAAAALGILLFALLVGRNLTRPIARLADWATSDRRRPPSRDGVRELVVLGDAMTAMATRLAEDRAREQRLGDVSARLGEARTIAEIGAVIVEAYGRRGTRTAAVLFPREDGALGLVTCVGLDRERLLAPDAAIAAARTGPRRSRVDGIEAGSSHWPPDAADRKASSLGVVVMPVRADGRLLAVVEFVGDVPLLKDIESGVLDTAIDRYGTAILRVRSDEIEAALRRELSAQNTALRTSEENLRSAVAALTTASRAKSQFLSSMSHELRTPLNAVLGFADVLLSDTHGSLDDTRRAFVADIRSAGSQLLRLVNDVLDLARIEAERVDLELANVDVDLVADEVRSLLSASAAPRSVTVRNDVAAGVSCRADRVRLRQVLVNLVSNAVRFTPAGGTVRMSTEPADGYVRIHVVDTGVGIAAADLAKLFEPFSTLAKRQAREVGTGLGLSIVRGLVERMGGRVGVKSEVGRGSDFWVDLPVADPSLATAATTVAPVAPTPATLLPPCRVLIIEDGDANRRVVRAMLRGTKVELTEATDAEAGLASIRASLPDVVLMDVQLPGMDGLTATRELRGDPATRAVQVIGLSAQAMVGDRERALAAGCDDYLAKPVGRAELLAAIGSALARKAK